MEIFRRSFYHINQNRLVSNRFLSLCAKPRFISTSSSLKTISEKYDNPETSYTNAGTKCSTTVDEKEINTFRRLADEWWKENGEFEALHRMNRLRVPLIRDAMTSYVEHLPKFVKEKLYESVDKSIVNLSAEPLTGLNILDIGCGGGILSEALARLGAQVTGVDACKENVLAAQMRLQSEYQRTLSSYCKRLRYLHCTIEELAQVEENSNYFDAVVMSEVLEHVINVDAFVECGAKLLKNQGYMFATTINKTLESNLFVIGLAEYVLNLVPRGTHEWNKFIRPDDLKAVFKRNDVYPKFEMGMFYNPLTRQWSWSQHDGMNYALYGQKMRPTLNTNQN